MKRNRVPDFHHWLI